MTLADCWKKDNGEVIRSFNSGVYRKSTDFEDFKIFYAIHETSISGTRFKKRLI